MFEKYNKINSLEDGNCSVNAFGLAFIDLIFAKLLDTRVNKNYTDFISKLSFLPKKKDENDWTAFKNFLEENKNESENPEKQSGPKPLQKLLAPFFRSIAVNSKTTTIVNNSPRDIESEKQAFQAEFRDHVYKALMLTKNEKFRGGDIYQPIDAIRSKFQLATVSLIENLLTNDKEFMGSLMNISIQNNLGKTSLNEEECKKLKILEDEIQIQLKDLCEWFNTTGYDEYVKHIGTSYKWLGDMELCEIGNYFDINIKAYNNENYLYSIRSNYGVIPSNEFDPPLSEAQIKLLMNRRIIDRTNNGIILLEMSEKELNKRLGSVANPDAVHDFWLNENRDSKYTRKVKDQMVLFIPDEWNEDLKNELIEREVITKQGYFYPDLDWDRLCDKISVFDRKLDFITLWKKYYVEKPLIVLSNPYAAHWYYLQPKEYSNYWESLKNLDVSNNVMENSYYYLTQQILSEYLAKLQKNLSEQSPKETSSSFQSKIISLTDTQSSEEKSVSGDSDSDNEVNHIFNNPHVGSENARMNPFYSDEEENPEHINIKRTWSNRASNTPSPTLGYSVFGFYAQNDNDWSSRSSPPPSKKYKVDIQLSYEAEEVLCKFNPLGNLFPNSEILAALKSVFQSIKKNKEISAEDSLLLIDLPSYLKIKNIEPIPELSESLAPFVQLHYNELLYKANLRLNRKLEDLLMVLLPSISSTENYVYKALNKICECLNNNEVLTQEICNEIPHFDLNKIDKACSEIAEIKEKSTDIKEILSLSTMIAYKTNIKISAKAIETLITDGVYYQPDLLKLKEYLKEVSKEFNKIDKNTLKSLLSMQPTVDFDDCDKDCDIKLMKELDFFFKVYHHDLEELLKEPESELDPILIYELN